MKKFIVLIITLLLALSFVPVLADDGDLTILFTHDMHDNFDAYTMLEDGEIHSRGGFERLATAIKEERQKDSELLLVDAGDYSMGTLYQSIYGSHSPALRLMTRLGYDATTFGNHEFDFRTKGLVDSLNTAKKHEENPVTIVASNTKFPEDKDLDDLKDAFENYGVVEDYHMVSKKGYNIAIIGLMGEEADTYAPMAEVEFANYIEEAKRVVKMIKDNEEVDMIIALSHSGTNDNLKKSEDELLVQAVPEIDVVISGHSHTTLDEPQIHDSSIVVSSGRYTENIGKLTLSKDQDRWTLKDYELIALKDNFKPDIAMTQELKKYKQAVEEAYLSAYGLGYDDVLAHAPKNFTAANDLGEELMEEPLGYLIADAYMYATHQIEGDANPVDVAVVPYGVIRDSITEGVITTKDAFKISSLGIGKDGLSGYPLISVYIKGKELKTAAEVDASIQPMQKVAQLYMSGLAYEFNPNRLIFNKVTDVKLLQNDEKVELEDNKLYRVVANLYTAQMLGLIEEQSKGLLSVTPLDVNGNEITDFEEHIIYDENGHELKEWIALANYLDSFDKEDGIPEEYYMAHGYKVINDDNSLIAKLKQPNKIALMIYAIILVVLLLIIFLIRFILRKVRRSCNEID